MWNVWESSAKSKSCWLEQTSYRRRFWSDSSNYSGRHHVLRCVYRACSLLRGKKDRVFYYNWAHAFKYKITLRHRHIVTHLMSLVAVNIKYNVQTKNVTESGLFYSTTFVTLSSSSTLRSTLDHVQYMKNKITLQDQHQLRCPKNIAKLFSFA